jgi:phenylacetate-CoA ligase
MTITPLDPWIKAKIGQHGGENLSAEKLYRYQTDRLKEVIAYVRRKSPFYRKHLAGVPKDFLSCPEDMAQLPFTTEADLRSHYLDMLCVSQSDISRIVTLFSSGSTAAPKRLFFTDEDLELTVDFFHHGMTTLTHPGSRVMIFMPGKTPGSIGDLLKKGLMRMNSEGFAYGPVTDSDDAIDALLKFKPHCLVGLPVQMLGLVRHPGKTGIPEGLIKSILLSADYVPAAIVAELENSLNATVYEHYGMTEMGLGGGVQCRHREGYHLREADLFFEVINPRTGRPQIDGRTGEIVFTTLTRRGMPLVRYRTGDLAAFLPGDCPCGTSLRRMGKVKGRISGATKRVWAV